MNTFANQKLTSESSKFWIPVLFYGFFLTDSMNWIGVVGGMDFRVGYMLAGLAILFWAAYGRLFISKRFVYLLVCVLGISVVASKGRGDILVASLIQVVGLFFFALVAYNLVKRLDLQRASYLYLTASKIVAVSILFEQLIFLIGGYELVNLLFLPFGGRSISYVTDGGILRASGILYEPSQAGLLLPPALYLALRQRDQKSATLASLGILGSFSGLAFVGATISVLFYNISLKKVLKALPIILIISPVFFISSVIQDRLDKVSTVLTGDLLGEDDPNQINSLQGSIGGMYVNTIVLMKGLDESPVIGHGIGSFAILFNEYLGSAFQMADDLTVLYPGQGKSLLIRVLFEFGLLGLLILLAFFFRHWLYVLKNRLQLKNGELRLSWVVTVIVFFLIYMIRKETYVSFYIWFFYFMLLAAAVKRRDSCLCII